jgi:hypothetical protein
MNMLDFATIIVTFNLSVKTDPPGAKQPPIGEPRIERSIIDSEICSEKDGGQGRN